MSADELNDVRVALGTILGNVRAIAATVESLEDRLARLDQLALRSVQLVQVIEDADAMLTAVPGALRQLGNDPTFGMFLAPVANDWADELERIQAARHAARTHPELIPR